MTLNYTRLRQITDDVADARVYAGIHFRFDQEAAETLGARSHSTFVRTISVVPGPASAVTSETTKRNSDTH